MEILVLDEYDDYVAYSKRKKERQRRIRLLFPSPAEVLWARIMGALVIRVPWIHYRYPLCIIVPWGWYRDNFIEREIMVAGFVIDFGNVKQRLGIEIDGRGYHDIVADHDRDEILARHGWVIMRIPAERLTDGRWVRRKSRSLFS